MKQKLLTLFLALVANVGIIYASNTSVGGIYYDFDSSTKTATVTYRGSSSNDYSNEYSGSVVIPSSVTYNGTTYSVTSIGNYAFYKCSSLTSVTIPNSVTSIGFNAFGGCSSLTSVTIPNSVTSIGSYAFEGTGIYVNAANWESGALYINNCLIGVKEDFMGDYTIKAGTRLIAGTAFYDCRKLTSITIPNSVTSIGEFAFEGCESLSSVTIPNSVTSIGYGAFEGCESLSSVTIPNSVTSIGSSAFYDCTSLTSVTIGNSVTSIGYEAFSYCRSLTSVTIPNSVTSIGNDAFEDCKSLTSITFEGTTPPVFGRDMFANTNNFSIYVPCGTKDAYVAALNVYNTIDASRVYSVQYTVKVESADESQGTVSVELVSIVGDEKNRIYYTSSNGNIVTPYSATVFGANIVSNTYQDGQGVIIFDRPVVSIGQYAFFSCSSLTSITIPNSVTSIGGWAFQSCSSLTSITIPNSVTIIGASAFNKCSSLTSVTIPNSVTSIGGSAFFSCSSLTSITIPNSVTSIGNYAFEDCSSLTSINVDSNNPNYSSVDGVLFNKDKTTLVVYPGGKKGAYTIPNSVTSIGYEAFSYCRSLTSVTIPNSVTSIGNYAFEDCSSLTSITFEGSTPPIFSRNVFTNTNNCPIYVPYGTKDAYVTALNVNNTIDASRVDASRVIEK